MRGFILLPVLLLSGIISGLLLSLIFVAAATVETENKLQGVRHQNNNDASIQARELYNGSVQSSLPADSKVLWGINQQPIVQLSNAFTSYFDCTALSGSLTAENPRPFVVAQNCLNPNIPDAMTLAASKENLIFSIPLSMVFRKLTLFSVGAISISSLTVDTAQPIIIALGNIDIKHISSNSCFKIFSLQGGIKIQAAEGIGMFDLVYKTNLQIPGKMVLGQCNYPLPTLPAFVFGMPRKIS